MKSAVMSCDFGGLIRRVIPGAILATLVLSMLPQHAAAQWANNPGTLHRYRLTEGRYYGACDEHPDGPQPDWRDAEEEAQSYGPNCHLVTINDEAENNWLSDTFGLGELWIGFTDMSPWSSEGNWVWTSGEPVTFTHWDQELGPQPDNYGNGEDSGHTNHFERRGQWNDLGDQDYYPAHRGLPLRGIIEDNTLITDQARALRFPGDQWARIADNPSLDFASAPVGTIEFWINWGGGVSRHIFGRRLGCDPSPYFYQAVTIPEQILIGWSPVAGGSSGPLPIGQWVHLAATTDGTHTWFLVNGIVTDMELNGAGLHSSSGDLLFGRSATCAPANCMLDEFRMWKVFRTPDQIACAYNREIDPSTPGLIGYWKFDEAYNQQVIVDSSPLHNDGLLGDSDVIEEIDPERIFTGAPLLPSHTSQWVGVADASWSEPGSWNPRCEPTLEDTAVVAQGSACVRNSDGQAARVKIMSPAIVRILGQSLKIGDGMDIEQGATLELGDVAASGSPTPSRVELQPGAELAIAGEVSVVSDSTGLEGEGRIVNTGSGSIHLVATAARPARLRFSDSDNTMENDGLISFVATSSPAAIDQGLWYLVNHGTIEMTTQDVGLVQLRGHVQNEGGEVTVDGNSSADAYEQSAGITRLQSGSLQVPGTDAIHITGGSVVGNGTILGDVEHDAGVIAPGFSPGSLRIFGDYNMGPAAHLGLELGNLASGIHDTLEVTGTATLDGSLDLALLPGITPAVGDLYGVIAAGSRSGTFDQVTMSGGSSSGLCSVSYSDSGIIVELESDFTDVAVSGPEAAEAKASPAGVVSFRGRFADNGASVFELGLVREVHVRLDIYDVRGGLVKTLREGREAAGSHAYRFGTADSGLHLASGLYFARLEVTDGHRREVRTARIPVVH